MIVCFICGIVSSILLYLYKMNEKNKMFLFFSFLILFLLSAFRYGIGVDYLKIYVKIFNLLAQGNDYDWDIGAIIICKIIQIFSQDYVYFFVITSFITLFLLFKAIVKYFELSPICLLLFVISGEYIASFNIVRQYLALAIFVYGIQYILKNDIKKYILTIVIATLFHSSAIILLPIYFLNKIKIKRLYQWYILLIIIIISPLLSKIFYTLLSLSKYNVYMSREAYSTADPTYSELITFSIVYIIAMFFYNTCKNDEKYNLFLNMLLVGLCIALLSFKIILAYRIILYFKIISVFMCVRILELLKIKNNKLIMTIIFIIMFSSLTLIGGYCFGWYDITYQSIFDVNREMVL